MGRVLVGFLAGVLLTAFGFLALMERNEPSKAAPHREEMTRNETGGAGNVIPKPAETTSSSATPIHTASSQRSDPELSLSETLVPKSARATRDEDPNEIPSATRQDQLPDRKAIPIADEIAPLLDDGPGRELHTKLEKEPRESSWAQYMEAQISAYLLGKPDLASFNIVYVGCRTTICEIQAIGYGTRAHAIWTTQISDITEQPWFEFSGMSGSARNVSPDVGDIIGILVILHKERE